MDIFFGIIIGYLIGSIPSAYLIVNIFAKKNITEEGSNNSGALNSYEVTGRKAIGIAVMFSDIIKGIIVVLIANFLYHNNFYFLAAITLWTVIGHNYSIFLRLKGGRGLASAAGIFMILNPFLLFTWLMMWVAAFYIIKRNVHVASSIALVGSSLLAFSTPDMMMTIFDILNFGNIFSIKILYTLISIVILIKHIKPLIEYANKVE